MGGIRRRHRARAAGAGFTAGAFQASLKRTRQAIKKALMDQKLIAGVGNIYANEALFAAGVDPSRSASSLSTG